MSPAIAIAVVWHYHEHEFFCCCKSTVTNVMLLPDMVFMCFILVLKFLIDGEIAAIIAVLQTVAIPKLKKGLGPS